MCGIAGYSFGNASRVNRTLAAQALLAGIAERGADAAGYAFRGEGPLDVHKQQTGASALLDAIVVPRCTRARSSSTSATTQRDTRRSLANNHPVRHGPVMGVHNGIIANDEALFAQHGIERDDPEMTVDSETIFALVEPTERRPRCSRSSSGRWRRPGSTSASPGCCISPAGSAGRSGSAAAA